MPQKSVYVSEDEEIWWELLEKLADKKGISVSRLVMELVKKRVKEDQRIFKN